MMENLFTEVKLIALDMDGTLLDADGFTIPEENIKALRAAHEKGIHLAIASGRLPDDAAIFALDMGLPMHIIALNGTCTMSGPGAEIQNAVCIQSHTLLAVMNILKESNLRFGLFSGNDLVINYGFESEEQAAKIWGCNIFRPQSRCTFGSYLAGAEKIIKQGVNKIVVFDDEQKGGLQSVRNQLIRLQGVEVCSSWTMNMEINPAGCSKGVALKALAESLGIPMSQVMAIGDNDNDLSMLSAAGIGVAMGNATPQAIEAASYITAHHTKCGVAKAIRAIALGETCNQVTRKNHHA